MSAGQTDSRMERWSETNIFPTILLYNEQQACCCNNDDKNQTSDWGNFFANTLIIPKSYINPSESYL